MHIKTMGTNNKLNKTASIKLQGWAK